MIGVFALKVLQRDAAQYPVVGDDRDRCPGFTRVSPGQGIRDGCQLFRRAPDQRLARLADLMEDPARCWRPRLHGQALAVFVYIKIIEQTGLLVVLEDVQVRQGKHFPQFIAYQFDDGVQIQFGG